LVWFKVNELDTGLFACVVGMRSPPCFYASLSLLYKHTALFLLFLIFRNKKERILQKRLDFNIFTPKKPLL